VKEGEMLISRIMAWHKKRIAIVNEKYQAQINRELAIFNCEHMVPGNQAVVRVYPPSEA
jgi:hypothetical protein